MFHRPPKQKGLPPLWEMELTGFETRWGCKNVKELQQPLCPLCRQPLLAGRWVRTLPGEQVVRCKCREHRRLYLAVTVEKDGCQWSGKAAIYKDAGPVAERYRKAVRKMQENARRKERAKTERAAG